MAGIAEIVPRALRLQKLACHWLRDMALSTPHPPKPSDHGFFAFTALRFYCFTVLSEGNGKTVLPFYLRKLQGGATNTAPTAHTCPCPCAGKRVHVRVPAHMHVGMRVGMCVRVHVRVCVCVVFVVLSYIRVCIYRVCAFVLRGPCPFQGSQKQQHNSYDLNPCFDTYPTLRSTNLQICR